MTWLRIMLGDAAEIRELRDTVQAAVRERDRYRVENQALRIKLHQTKATCAAVAKANVRLARYAEQDELLLVNARQIIRVCRLALSNTRDRSILDDWLSQHKALKR